MLCINLYTTFVALNLIELCAFLIAGNILHNFFYEHYYCFITNPATPYYSLEYLFQFKLIDFSVI